MYQNLSDHQFLFVGNFYILKKWSQITHFVIVFGSQPPMYMIHLEGFSGWCTRYSDAPPRLGLSHGHWPTWLSYVFSVCLNRTFKFNSGQFWAVGWVDSVFKLSCMVRTQKTPHNHDCWDGFRWRGLTVFAFRKVRRYICNKSFPRLSVSYCLISLTRVYSSYASNPHHKTLRFVDLSRYCLAEL